MKKWILHTHTCKTHAGAILSLPCFSGEEASTWHFMAILCSAQFSPLLLSSPSCSLSGGFPLKMQRNRRTRRLAHFNETLSLLLSFFLHLIPYLCFVFIHFTVSLTCWSLLYIHRSPVAHSAFPLLFTLLLPVLSSSLLSPSNLPCLLQLPPSIPRLSFIPPLTCEYALK